METMPLAPIDEEPVPGHVRETAPVVDSLDEEQLTKVLVDVAREHPVALSTARALMVERPANNSEVDDMEFDAEDEIALRSVLLDVTKELHTNQVKVTEQSFCRLRECLEHAHVHMEVGDWSSAVRILECIIDVCTFQWPQSRETFFSTPCQQFFQHFRVAWETVLGLASTMPTAERTDLMRRLITWDPTVEFRLPDDWSVIFNECREGHFAVWPSQKIIVDVHELWEKMKRTSVTSTQRQHPDLSKEECVTVSNANLAIIIAEVERFMDYDEQDYDGDSEVGLEDARSRAFFARMVAQNGYWRRKLNDFVCAAESVGAIGVDFDDIELLPPECASKTRWQHGGVPDTAPLYFWHYIIGGGGFQDSEGIVALITCTSRFSTALDEATVDSVARKADKGVVFHGLLGESYSTIDMVLKSLENEPKPSNLHQEIFGMVMNSARLLKRLNQYTEAINRDLIVKMERCSQSVTEHNAVNAESTEESTPKAPSPRSHDRKGKVETQTTFFPMPGDQGQVGSAGKVSRVKSFVGGLMARLV